MEITWKILKEVVDKIKENGIMYFYVKVTSQDTYFQLLRMTSRKLVNFLFQRALYLKYWENNKNTMSIRL